MHNVPANMITMRRIAAPKQYRKTNDEARWNEAPKRATRSTPSTENLTITTVTNAQLQAMIDQGVTAALVARDANRNGDDSHTSEPCQKEIEHAAFELHLPGYS
ncbi:hypothetical protein Tco_0052253 [Tanacetum coccineum]|uniref:Uncharacterized protein n=1 Tax=Tanacetum coccineum TaxID=301880 RepID=A0ABQ5ETW9_9ASTR